MHLLSCSRGGQTQSVPQRSQYYASVECWWTSCCSRCGNLSYKAKATKLSAHACAWCDGGAKVVPIGLPVELFRFLFRHAVRALVARSRRGGGRTRAASPRHLLGGVKVHYSVPCSLSDVPLFGTMPSVQKQPVHCTRALHCTLTLLHVNSTHCQVTGVAHRSLPAGPGRNTAAAAYTAVVAYMAAAAPSAAGTVAAETEPAAHNTAVASTARSLPVSNKAMTAPGHKHTNTQTHKHTNTHNTNTHTHTHASPPFPTTTRKRKEPAVAA